MSGIFNLIKTNEAASTVDDEYDTLIGISGISDLETTSTHTALSLESASNIEYSLKLIDDGITANTLTCESYSNNIELATTEALKMLGAGSELYLTLESLGLEDESDLTLTIEAYKKKRSGVIDDILTNIWSALDNITTADSWKSAFTDISSLLKSSRSKLDKLEGYIAEVKDGTRVIKKELAFSKSTRRKLGIYSARESVFDYTKYNSMVEEFIDLFKGGIIEDGMHSVHDNLVQSKDEESHINTNTKSLKFIEKFDKVDLEDVLYKDTKIIFASSVNSSVLETLQIVQDNKDGINFYARLTRIDEDLYNKLKIGNITKEALLKNAEYLVKETPFVLKLTKTKQIKLVIKEWVKNIRSKIATVIYAGVFGIFSARRVLRQAYLANTYIQHLIVKWLKLLSGWVGLLDLNITLIEELTEVKRK